MPALVRLRVAVASGYKMPFAATQNRHGRRCQVNLLSPHGQRW